MNLLKKNSSKIIITALVIIICLIPFRKKIIRKMKSLFGYSKKGGFGQSAECINCPTLFNDLPPAHEKAYINNQFLDIDEIDNLIEQYNNYNNKKNKKLATISTVFGKLQVVLEDNNIESSNRQYYHNI